MAIPRSSGILLHLTSLPGKYGIGDLGAGAYQFVDFLEQAGQTAWQILPLGPTSYGDSPYQALSAFAGNTLLISLDQLMEDGWLDPADIANMPSFSEYRVEYGQVIEFHNRMLSRSFEKFQDRATSQQKGIFESFCQSESNWLDEFALFSALKDHFSGRSWVEWEPKYALRALEAIADARQVHAQLIKDYQFRQWLFFTQWKKLKAYANEKQVRIIGDMPIFVGHDSCDVWANPNIFKLDDQGYPTVVAGVPPDYFSATGQRWGNPLFNWNVLRQQGFGWWIKRLQLALRLVDYIRIDHFRGFDVAWEIPAEEATAVMGQWVQGPRAELFEVVRSTIGDPGEFMIAEDLGFIEPSMIELRNRYNIPGMKVLQFAFLDPSNEYLPHNFDTTNCVVYTGTHDNNTVLGWYAQETFDTQKELFRACVGHETTEPHWDMIRLAMQSIAHTAIYPLQDVLGFGAETRMNAPGATADNWSWRYSQTLLTSEISKRLHDMTGTFNRLPSRFEKTE